MENILLSTMVAYYNKVRNADMTLESKVKFKYALNVSELARNANSFFIFRSPRMFIFGKMMAYGV